MKNKKHKSLIERDNETQIKKSREEINSVVEDRKQALTKITQLHHTIKIGVV